MWAIQNEELPDARGQRFAVTRNLQPANFVDVLCGWQDDAGFRSLFNDALADAPYTAFRWETPAVTTATVGRPFEFVLLDSPELDRRSDPGAFADRFESANESVAVFPNLGSNAILVVPCPVADPTAYGHLAAFVRFAPESQRHALWQRVGQVMMFRIGVKSVWLNTAGAGVPWLHVRLDDRPKYYGFAPYR